MIRDSLEPFASGQIGRYDDEFEVRAFGDNLTLWGTPVVLIETGPWPSREPDPPLVRLNFIAILSALDSLATGQVDKADPERYEALPKNESKTLYLVVTNATVINGAGIKPYAADIGVMTTRRVQVADGRRELQVTSTIDDMGDLRTSGALTNSRCHGIDCRARYRLRGRRDGGSAGLEDERGRDDCSRTATSHRAAARRRRGQVPGRDDSQVAWRPAGVSSWMSRCGGKRFFRRRS